MNTLGNIVWFIFAGFWDGLAWLFFGVLWCLTLIGIPVGVQCFKLAALSFWPFGKEVVYEEANVSFLLNVIWIIVSGIPLAAAHIVTGIILYLTIIGIPFANQCFKLARLSLMPFGAHVVKEY